MLRLLLVSFHAASAGAILFGFYWTHLIGMLSLAGIAKMFTLWTACALVVYFLACVVEDLVRSGSSFSKTLRSLLSDFFHLTFIMSVATVILFWSIYLLNPENMVPKGFYYPDGLNHIHHTLPLVIVLIEMIVVRSRTDLLDGFWTRKFYLICVVPVIYLSLTGLTRYLKGTFPYPFMQAWGVVEFTIFYVFATTLAIFMHYVVYWFVNAVKKASPSKKLD
ncbi:hypothetical protein FDP41_002941 [Naegleria fowleri]|uniref:Uncharacterized protein n=1 Tax=Naegleria fowleri TaxID=5763 RepID=A0A6A5BYN4_NAEFO|nr:uncharacterized protein FDP41_002941 [Naegleria fowleri]KAF0978049.1 hypothetical protein FDP41_002941 [Naegleria fowleri]CAG4717422.1 unnamed protein product [Naegleria fowleri]